MTVSDSITISTESPEETQRLGRCLGPGLRSGDVIALHGDLGAGKTCFVQGLAHGMEVTGRVSSPTFIIMRRHNPSQGDVSLYHVDAYRLGSGDELWEMGIEDWLYNGVVVIEWAELVAEALPEDHLDVKIDMQDTHREFRCVAHGTRSRQIVEYLQRCRF
ncbi:MAG: tRNA (adenosine(37)-N6)-threonylcarbamoyltransferase complex ATPase subunit type 1 TsaE [Armatimonadia bacterium]